MADDADAENFISLFNVKRLSSTKFLSLSTELMFFFLLHSVSGVVRIGCMFLSVSR